LVYSNATYALRIHAVGVTHDLRWGMTNVPLQTWGTFRYWQVNVPDNALGWDIG